jgi:hypothetical protein
MGSNRASVIHDSKPSLMDERSGAQDAQTRERMDREIKASEPER